MGSGMSTFASGVASSAALIGVEWNRHITFIQYVPFSEAVINKQVSIEEMPEFADSFKDVIVKNVWSYICSFSGDHKKVDSVHHHRFIVVETSHGYFSFDHGATGITVQFSSTKDNVVNKLGGVLREFPEFWHDENYNIYANLKEILEWISSNNELYKGYNFIFNNCHHFMKRLVFKMTGDASGY